MDKKLIQLSKTLSWVLRHGAIKEGFNLHEGGYIDVEELLKHKNFKQFTLRDIEEVVKTNNKQRFHLRTDDKTGKILIRANQGHSIQVDDLELIPIESPDQVPMVIHGTYKKYLNKIQEEGLSKMKRNHIHFSCREFKDKKLISGMRNNVEVLIYIDLEKALNDGFKFFFSANEVVLCPGNEDGFLPSLYFKDVKVL